MDKIEKTLEKLSAPERSEVKDVLLKLQSGNFKELHIKKLRGREDIFRIRKGNIRIIYQAERERIFILSISRRKEYTYKA